MNINIKNKKNSYEIYNIIFIRLKRKLFKNIILVNSFSN